jgi:hypothetical protein
LAEEVIRGNGTIFHREVDGLVAEGAASGDLEEVASVVEALREAGKKFIRLPLLKF